MQKPVMFYSPRRSINSSPSVPLDGAFWTAIHGEQRSLLTLLPAFSTPTVSPSSARSPHRRLQ